MVVAASTNLLGVLTAVRVDENTMEELGSLESSRGRSPIRAGEVGVARVDMAVAAR